MSPAEKMSPPQKKDRRRCGCWEYCGQDAQYLDNTRTFTCYSADGSLQDPCDPTAHNWVPESTHLQINKCDLAACGNSNDC